MGGKSTVVFFDIGHTLVRGSYPSARRLLASELSLSEKETKKAGRLMMIHPSETPIALAGALKKILPGRSKAEIKNSLEKLWELQMADVEEIDGATSALKSLKNEGIKLAVLSNIWRPFYEGFCRTCPQMVDLIDYKYLSYQVGYKKPNLQFFHYALQKAGVPANYCWMVGDTYELDMAPALKVGMRTIWLLNYPDREKSTIAKLLRGEERPPDWVAEDLHGVSSFLLNREE